MLLLMLMLLLMATFLWQATREHMDKAAVFQRWIAQQEIETGCKQRPSITHSPGRVLPRPRKASRTGAKYSGEMCSCQWLE